MTAIRSAARSLVPSEARHAHNLARAHVSALARHTYIPQLPAHRWFGDNAAHLPVSMPIGANAALGSGNLALLGAQTTRLRAATAVEPSGKPQIGDYGFDEAGMDRASKPGDDFNRFASGKALDAIQIPNDLGSYGAFIGLREQSNARMKEIVESVAKGNAAPGSDDAKLGTLYTSFMDTATVEAQGATPIKPELDAIAGIKTSSDVVRVMGELSRRGGTSLFALAIGPDSKNPQSYIAQLNQDGLGLPDRDFYFNTDARSVEIRDKYKKHIASMLKLAGIADADAKADTIFDLETKIASVHWNNVDSRDADKTYNVWSRAHFDIDAPGVDWKAYLGAVGVGDETKLIVAQPSAITGMAKLVGSVSPAIWKDYLTFHTIKNAAPLLAKSFVDEDFDFSGRTLSGLKEQGPRWKRAIAVSSNGLSDAIAKHYVAKYFPPETKAHCEQLVKNVIAAMGERLDHVDWMAPETRAKAKEKLAAFTAMIGYPDGWRDYSAIDIKPGQLYRNVQNTTAFEYERNLKKLGAPVDRREWFMTPMTVNAYADPGTNSIVFPAAILQPPFFDPNADDAINYGAIGAVIGHEISHHFDDQGRKFDKDGKLTDWWTEQDVKSFTARTAKVVAQYNAFEPIAGTHVNGELTLGENMADLAGINVAYDAYKKSLGGKEAPVINGMTGDQRFFLGFAQVWRTKYRDATLKNLLATDPHSPGMVRAGIVRNIDAWYGAFGVKPGDAMYLPPEQRLRVW